MPIYENRRRHVGRSNLFAVVMLTSSAFLAQAADQPGHVGEWVHHGSDLGNTKYSPLDRINKANFHDLKIAWRWTSIDAPIIEGLPGVKAGAFKATPLVVDGMLYVVTALGQVAALQPDTGELIWEFDPKSYKAGRPAGLGFQHRGVSYWSDGADSRIVFATHDRKLWALDAKTGEPEAGFGDHGRVDLEQTLGTPAGQRLVTHTSPVAVAGDTIVVGSVVSDVPSTKEMPPGHVRGFDARTGEFKWIIHTIPQKGEFGVETWENESWKYSGNTNVWSIFAVDAELGYVYMPVSSPTNDMYGGHRLGDNLFADSLVCVDAESGERVWHYQVVHHPLWDYDLPAPPVLADIVVDGKQIRAVALVTKQAFCFVFDRVTGEPVWPIVERPVPQSRVPGERTSPTQPFPTKPAPFDRQGLTDDDLVDFTPELRAAALEILEGYERGELYTPPNDGTGVFGLPGLNGGASWAGAALDPETGILYVPSHTEHARWKLVQPDPARSNLRYIGLFIPKDGPDTSALEDLPLHKPPYSRVTALDLNTGEHVWMTPNGDGPVNHPLLRHLDLPPLGQVDRNKTGIMVTKSLLFVTRHAASRGAPQDRKPRISVFDKTSGELLGVIPLPGDPYGNPMTYLHDGKQYICVAIGGVEMLDFRRRYPSELVALALPD